MTLIDCTHLRHAFPIKKTQTEMFLVAFITSFQPEFTSSLISYFGSEGENSHSIDGDMCWIFNDIFTLPSLRDNRFYDENVSSKQKVEKC